MKSILIFIAISFLHSSGIFAQCAKEQIAGAKGKWTEGMKGSTYGVTAAVLAKEKIILDQIHSMLKQSFAPVGGNADYNQVFQGQKSTYRYANIFGYGLRFMPYVCRDNKMEIAHETHTSMYIYANMIASGAEIFEPFIDAMPWDEGFRSINNMPVEKNGIYYFQNKTSLGFGLQGVESNWLITYDGKLPFTYVTRKEFLERKKQKLAEGRKDEENRLNENYKVKDDTYKNLYDKTVKIFDVAIQKIDLELKESVSELNQAAIVKKDEKDFLSHLFTNADDPFARILIKSNPGYFNNKLPKHVVQFLSVMMKGYDKDPLFNNAMQQWEKAIDFSKLKSLLGK